MQTERTVIVQRALSIPVTTLCRRGIAVNRFGVVATQTVLDLLLHLSALVHPLMIHRSIGGGRVGNLLTYLIRAVVTPLQLHRQTFRDEVELLVKD